MLYNLLVLLIIGLGRLAALFNNKARLLVNGRKGLLTKVRQALQGKQEKRIWFHCASLGEFEQGRPLMEALKQSQPNYKIFLTFFSPSGYEVRKNYAGADYVFYLPYDLPGRCRAFVSLVKPVLAVFIKYEFWPNLFDEMAKQKVPVISASSIFRSDQIYFSSYGKRQRETLKSVRHFFVQNQESVGLLKKIGITNVSISGDTRFDRVYQIFQGNQENMIAKKFKNDQQVWVIGSCWPEDWAILSHFINMNLGKLKFIIAPHEISENFITDIVSSIEGKAARYSKAEDGLENFDALVIDNIGLLSTLYRYGEFAYVGGGFGKGLHNILEAACFGIPVFFGNKNYEKFREAINLIDQGGAFAIADFVELKKNYEMLAGDPENYMVASNASRNFVEMNLGATQKIISYCEKLLKENEGQGI
jgi:3-deoxy-D-manno-octulosonic-acid transferase